MRRTLSIASLLTLVAGCGGGQDYDTELEGIYQLTSWTHNAVGCGEEGPVFDRTPVVTHFYVRSDVFLGVPFVGVSVCENLEYCRYWSDDYDTVYNLTFRLDDGGDQDGWTGNTTQMVEGGEMDDVCTGEVYQAVLSGNPRSEVRIEQETKTVSEVPVMEHNACDYDVAYRRADDLPCEQLTVVTGTYLEPI